MRDQGSVSEGQRGLQGTRPLPTVGTRQGTNAEMAAGGAEGPSLAIWASWQAPAPAQLVISGFVGASLGVCVIKSHSPKITQTSRMALTSTPYHPWVSVQASSLKNPWQGLRERVGVRS